MFRLSPIHREVVAQNPWTPNDVIAVTRPIARESRYRSIPDLIGYQDLLNAPESTAQVLEDRRTAGLVPAPVERLLIPKPGTDERRAIAILDPFDDVQYRALVGRVVVAIELACARLGNTILKGRLKTLPPGWTTKGFVYSRSLRSERALDFIDSGEFHGLALADARHCYQHINTDILSARLDAEGAGSNDIADLATWLQGASTHWNIEGLPAGLEASVPLANVVLLPVDRELARLGFEHERWVDDTWGFLTRSHSWRGFRVTYKDQMERVEQAVNYDKLKFLRSRDRARHSVSDPELDRLSDKVRRGDEARALTGARILFHKEIARDEPNPSRVRYCLGRMGRAGCREGVDALMSNPDLMGVAPKAFGDYLGNILRQNREVDLDWLHQEATQAPHPLSQATQVHLVRACRSARPQWGRTHGEAFESLALDGDLSEVVPLRCFAADAWAGSKGWKATNALDAAQDIGHPQLRRALVVSTRSDRSRKANRAREQLKAEPECRPAIEWLRKAA